MTQNINPMPELQHMAKQLRLSGLLESLGQRNKEAIQRQLTYPEFLAVVLQDEMLRREQKKFDFRTRRSGFNPNKTIESFDFLFNPNINKAEILDITSCEFIKEKVCVFIMGPCGTGKSHLAQAIAQNATQANIDSLFITQAKLLSNLQAARATGVYEKCKRALIKIPLLIIDDFGLTPLRTPQDEDFYNLVSERYEKAATVITSNLDFEEWIQVFPNQVLGTATLDRLRHGAYSIVLDGKSYRACKTEKKNNENTKKRGSKIT
jgi:DNA replication protein DnaC